MEKILNESLEELESKIYDFEIESDFSIQRIEVVIDIILKHLAGLKTIVLENGFRDSEHEIRFFKYQKPSIVAKLIYYNALYKIETKKPYGKDSIKDYLSNEGEKLKRFFDNNLDFYKYYRTNSTYLDHKYFLRGKADIKLSVDTYYFEADHRFSTSHDYKVAKIIANDMIQVYLEDQLSHLNKLPVMEEQLRSAPNSFTWTGSKTSLIELIYALHSKSVINNGNIDIKEIAQSLEIILNIDLGDFYHTFMELKSRKVNRTKFLDSLRDALIRKMDEQDEI